MDEIRDEQQEEAATTPAPDPPAAAGPKRRRFRLLPEHHRRKIIAALFFIAHLLGALTSVQAIMQTRTPQGAIAWGISLNTFPYVTVPAYWVLGRSKFRHYETGRQKAFDATHPLVNILRTRYVEQGLVSAPDTRSATVLEKIARLPFTGFNDVRLLVDGEETFGAIFDAIDRAQDYILVQFYIVRDDALGRELRDRLAARAREGVKVLFLYDEIGSNGLPDAYLQPLVEAGAQVAHFNSTKGPANRFQLNFRNHRKNVVIDGREAFIGGLNVGDEYMGRSRRFPDWRDTHAHVVGPVAQFAQLSFVEDWNWATSAIPELSWHPVKSTTGTQTALVLPSGPADPFETCTLFFLDVINNAHKRLWIASPYFVPDEQMLSALELAALRGTDVRVLVPRVSDNAVVQLATFSYLERCERAGIKVLWYDRCFMHQKVILADDNVAAVGTANFDNRSFRLNFEIMLVVKDEGFNARVARMLERDFRHSTPSTFDEVSSGGLPRRLAVKVARLFSPVL